MHENCLNYHTTEFIAVFIPLRDQSLFKFEGGEGGGENVGPSTSSSTTWGGGVLEKSKGGLGVGSSLIKVRNFHSPYFGIIFEAGS